MTDLPLGSPRWLGLALGLCLCMKLGVCIAGPTTPAAPRPPEPAAWQPFPTMATAGARSCTLGSVVTLGPGGHGEPVVGFGKAGGLVVWKQSETVLAVQALTSSGSALGKPGRLQLEASQEPAEIYAIEHGFLVILKRWDWKHRDAQWWAVLLSADARAPRGVTDLGLAGMDLTIGQAMDGDRVALLVHSAIIAKKEQPGRWQTLSVDPDGTIHSTATAVAVDDLASDARDRFEPARLDGAVGWVVLRSGVRLPDGVFDGKRRPAAAAVLLRGSDGIQAAVQNLATPPGSDGRRGGMIKEAMPEPALARTRDGKPVGQATELVVQGTPVGVAGLGVHTHFGWSGTHFIYPFTHSYYPVNTTGSIQTARLLPIDCHP